MVTDLKYRDQNSMSDVLTQVLLRKGDTAGKFLASEGWPKNTRQKIIEKKYNSEYKKTAKDTTTKLPSPTPLSWPSVPPATYKILKSDAVKLMKELGRLSKIQNELQTEVDFIWSIRDGERNSIMDRMDSWGTKFLKYQKDQDSLYDQCVKTASTCKDVKIGLKMSKKKTAEATKQLKKLDKEMSKHNDGPNKRMNKELDELRKKIKPLKLEQEALMKELLSAGALVAKLAIVMP